MPLLSTLIFAPLFAALLIAVLPGQKLARWIGLGSSLCFFVLSVLSLDYF